MWPITSLIFRVRVRVYVVVVLVVLAVCTAPSIMFLTVNDQTLFHSWYSITGVADVQDQHVLIVYMIPLPGEELVVAVWCHIIYDLHACGWVNPHPDYDNNVFFHWGYSLVQTRQHLQTTPTLQQIPHQQQHSGWVVMVNQMNHFDSSWWIFMVHNDSACSVMIHHAES